MVVDIERPDRRTDRLFFALSDATRRDIVAQTLDRERSVSELVRGEIEQLRRAHELLDELEALWRARLDRLEDVLNDITGKGPE